MTYKIDKGLKIPSIYSRHSQWRELIKDMEEGDSIGELTSRESINLATLMRLEGIKAVARKMVVGKIDKNDPVYRVWHGGWSYPSAVDC